MRVFISYAREQQQEDAEKIASKLQALGMSVFFDKFSLPPGERYGNRIRQAVDDSDLFIFLISPGSVVRGSYALTELGYAKRKWPNPDGRVLPVMQVQTPFKDIDPYLTESVSILRPTGSFATDVADAAEDLLKRIGSSGPATLREGPVGKWLADFTYVDGETYREVVLVQRERDDLFVGTILPSVDNCLHTAEVDHLRPVRISGALNGTQLLTGTWYHPALTGVHGAFQMRLSFEAEALSGGWLMHSERLNRVISGQWSWQRQGRNESRSVGIYGIPGAGKTTLCDGLIRAQDGYASFSESSVIDQYMRRFRDETLEDFKERSEPDRMMIREESFEFHAERIRNSRTAFVGDAHYSFPLQRLGSRGPSAAHPEAENGIQPVMPEAAWSIYHAVIYLDTPAGLVRERLREDALKTGRRAWAAGMNLQELEAWIDYEKRRLALQCEKRRKPFLVLPGSGAVKALVERAQGLIESLQDKAY